MIRGICGGWRGSIAIGSLLAVAVLSWVSPAAAFINRSYSSLDEAEIFTGDFDGILRQGKLRILLTHDFTDEATSLFLHGLGRLLRGACPGEGRGSQ